MSSRRGFLRQLGSGAVIAAAVPIVGSSLVAPAASPMVMARAPAVASSFAAVLAATRDVYSSEIWLHALPVMRLGQFTSKLGVLVPRFHNVERNNLEVQAIEDRIRSRVAWSMDNDHRRALKKRRRFFDLGWLRAA